ncbi:MAM domain-containing glycosylphosphatidylinositol anchor protein 2-like [Photinus pyralis]|uniref:MAM domain-containing glycosylphosphatidylinositol anchor protein 2-like n=1 Tax=Photinus pyralis TaxID=7054 RepID=UPI0012676880|nr:MAM domain-containing glycosylphosphatidylinositol anchor protein 2-like [Photinus pyralis]
MSGSSVLVWRKGSNLISAGHHLITSDRRFLLQSFNLQLRGAKITDQGDYTCQIGDGSLGDLIHTVEILIPPNLQIIPPENQVTAKQGGSVLFECQATGNPAPIVQWSKKDGILPSGLQVESGSTLSLNDLQKQHAGMYQCTASNGIGQPATSEVKLQVLYPPEVHVVRSWYNTGDSLEAKLSCLINADPPAEVLWYQNSFPLQPTDKRSITSSGTTSTLTIRNVQFSDFGNYSCVVLNSIGRDKKYIEISGKPGVAEIISPGFSNPNSYRLTWNVQSVFPIVEAKILFRRLLINTTYHHHDQWHDMIVRPNEVSFNSESTERLQQYQLNGLVADSVYECLIQTKSQYGYSELSNLHQWFTSRVGRQIESVGARLSSFFSTIVLLVVFIGYKIVYRY